MEVIMMIYRLRNFGKISNKIFYVSIIAMLLIALTATPILAANDNQDIIELNIQVPPVVSALPILWILENNMLYFDVDVSVGSSLDHQRNLSLLAQEEVDMIITGVNVGARAFNRG